MLNLLAHAKCRRFAALCSGILPRHAQASETLPQPARALAVLRCRQVVIDFELNGTPSASPPKHHVMHLLSQLCVSLFYVTTLVQQGPGDAPGERPCIPLALTLTLAMPFASVRARLTRRPRQGAPAFPPLRGRCGDLPARPVSRAARDDLTLSNPLCDCR